MPAVSESCCDNPLRRGLPASCLQKSFRQRLRRPPPVRINGTADSRHGVRNGRGLSSDSTWVSAKVTILAMDPPSLRASPARKHGRWPRSAHRGPYAIVSMKWLATSPKESRLSLQVLLRRPGSSRRPTTNHFDDGPIQQFIHSHFARPQNGLSIP